MCGRGGRDPNKREYQSTIRLFHYMGGIWIIIHMLLVSSEDSRFIKWWSTIFGCILIWYLSQEIIPTKMCDFTKLPIFLTLKKHNSLMGDLDQLCNFPGYLAHLLFGTKCIKIGYMVAGRKCHHVFLNQLECAERPPINLRLK